MAKVLITESILENTADAIRDLTGGSEGLKPSEFAGVIEEINPDNIWIGTQVQYDNLETYSNDILYFIKEV